MPWWFPVLFVLFWFVLSAFLTHVSGWLDLARKFRTQGKPEGEEIVGQVRAIGGTMERGITKIIVSQSGLYLYPILLYRIFRSPFLVPWSLVRLGEVRKTQWLGAFYDLEIDGITKIKVTAAAYKVIRKYLTTP